MPTAIHAIYENGVFRPVQPVDLPERCEVEVDIRAVNRELPDENRDPANGVRGRCYLTHKQGVTARPNELEIENNPGDELQAVWESCSEPDWDGYGAVAASQDALRNSRRFLDALPPDFPAPSIGAEPDGALTMEWHGSERRTLSVSVSSGEELHFAGLFGSNRVYGSEAFLAEIPQPILDLIRRVYAE
jgi:predicted DNA-binding antitoxin AbrB/MazE fold protein